MDVTKVFISRISPVWLPESTCCVMCSDTHKLEFPAEVVIDEIPYCRACAREILGI